MVIALDRQERGRDARSAIQEVEETLGITVISIVKLEHLVQYLLDRANRAEDVEKYSPIAHGMVFETPYP